MSNNPSANSDSLIIGLIGKMSMSEKEKKYVSWIVFVWVIGIIFVIFGYQFTELNRTNAKVETSAIESQKIQAQLSQIQTDIQWIKASLQKDTK